MVIEYDIVPGQVDHYLAAAKENAAAAVKEPGCRAFDILVSQKDPNHVLLVEAYDNAAAWKHIVRRRISKNMRASSKK